MLKRIVLGEAFGADAKQYKSVRIVLLDDKNRVALLHIGVIDFYTLPGGTIDEGETPEQAAVRETKEETGYDSEIICRLGIIEESSKMYDWNGVNTCFMARVKGGKGRQNLTQREVDEGINVQWHGLNEALGIVMNQKIDARDEKEAGRDEITRQRDIILLNEAIRLQA